MTMLRDVTLVPATAVLLGLFGCAQGVEVPDGEPVVRKQCPVTYSTGDSLHSFGFLQHVVGRGLNGTNLNGRVLEGVHVAYVDLESAAHDGAPMSDVSLRKSKFRGRTSTGKLLRKRRFENVHFAAYTDTGTEVELVIRNAHRFWQKGLMNTFLYDVEYRVDGGWLPLCGVDDEGEPIEALALRGRWDYREGVEGGGDKIDDPGSFTFACRGHVAAKCVEMGYQPWRKALVCHIGEGCEVQKVGHLHQACTRMLRGDYCGDGTAHTTDGVPVNAYDGYGIRYDSDDWDIEAEWTPDGARCAERVRVGALEDLSCASDLGASACGDAVHFVEGTSLISELPPQP